MAFPDLSAELIQQGLATHAVGRRVIYLPQVSSTMEAARHEAQAGALEGTVVLAEEQTAGRGRFGRGWVSPPGQNLYFSVVLYPRLEELHQLNMAAALALVRAIRSAVGLQAAVKWPNDIRFKGKKAGGILIESSLEGPVLKYAIVGFGVNVNMDPQQHPEIASIATSLRSEKRGEVSRLAQLREILAELDALYAALREGRSVREEWAAHLETLGKWVQVRWGQERVEGWARAVDQQGNLVLERPDGTSLTVTAGEVTFQL